MMKICLIVVLAFAAIAQAQDGNDNAAPEPYSYGYETDTHSAAEQKDPSGAVTGYYTIADADGRQRRVEYVADASGFRAKVMTNEMGTKSANSADVEVLASPPNPEQLVYQAPQQQQQVVQVQRQQSFGVQQAPVSTTTSQKRVVSQEYFQQPQLTSGYQYGAGSYYPGYAYGASYGNAQTVNGLYASGNPYGYYYANLPAGYGSNQATYYSYNNHLPSQYYRSLQTTSGNLNGGLQQQQVGGLTRYVTTTTTNNVQPANTGYSYQTFGRSGYQTRNSQLLQAPGAATYTTSQAQTRSGNLAGSSNYIVLKKRDSTEDKKEN